METIVERLNGTPDYGEALLVDGEHDAKYMLDLINRSGGCLFLSMAEGALGVLRAMAVRTGPMRFDGRYDGVKTLIAVKVLDGIPYMHLWILRPAPPEPDTQQWNSRPGWNFGNAVLD